MIKKIQEFSAAAYPIFLLVMATIYVLVEDGNRSLEGGLKMSVIKIIFNVLNFLTNIAAVFWLGSFLLYGGLWQVGNFMSLGLPGILRKSKRLYKEDDK